MNSSKLKGIRVEKGKTQKNMAELIGKSLVTYPRRSAEKSSSPMRK